MKKVLSLYSQSIYLIVNIVIVSAIWGCSKNRFSVDPGYKPCQESGVNCVSQNGYDYFSSSLSGLQGKVDILFVDDNSASMSYEQSQLAARFRNFVQNLDSNSIDYHIAITTTDISSGNNSSRSINKNGALQDGHLIAFSDGTKFLNRNSGSISNKESLFSGAIVRSETLSCEQFLLTWSGSRDSAAYDSAYNQNCPSGDERGIYAASSAVSNNESEFIRDGANFVVIFLSDEDVRSQLYWWNEPGFTLDKLDQAESFVNNLKMKYPNKQIVVHSIVTASEACLATQNSQTNGLVSASYGLEYKKLSDLTGGIVIDICSVGPTYTEQIGNISASILQGLSRYKLLCKDMSKMRDLNISFKSNPAGLTYSVAGNEIVFSDNLTDQTVLDLSYACEKL